MEEVSKLENVPDSQKDWHPGSDKQVLDLVHPSLYCLVYGVSQIYNPVTKKVFFYFIVFIISN